MHWVKIVLFFPTCILGSSLCKGRSSTSTRKRYCFFSTCIDCSYHCNYIRCERVTSLYYSSYQTPSGVTYLLYIAVVIFSNSQHRRIFVHTLKFSHSGTLFRLRHSLPRVLYDRRITSRHDCSPVVYISSDGLIYYYKKFHLRSYFTY